MSNCIYEKTFMENGLSQMLGLSTFNCGLITIDQEICDKCLELAKEKQIEFFKEFEYSRKS